MNKLLIGASAAIALLASASTASALAIVGSEGGNLDGTGWYSGLAYGHQILWDFDGIANSNFTFSADTATNFTRSGGLVSGVSAPPPVPVNPALDPEAPGTVYDYETTNYHTVTNGGFAAFTAVGGTYLSAFSFYLGSPDDFNSVTFRLYDTNGVLTTLSGSQIWNDQDAANGDQSWGRRVYYDFQGAKIAKIEFQSNGGNSFEFDGLAGVVGGVVPEPGTWALMIMGFGGAGAMLRRRKAVLA